MYYLNAGEGGDLKFSTTSATAFATIIDEVVYNQNEHHLWVLMNKAPLQVGRHIGSLREAVDINFLSAHCASCCKRKQYDRSVGCVSG